MSIRDDFFDKKNKAALWDVGVSINRTNPLPIDKNSVFDTIENLNTYVNGVLSYPGQVVALVTETETKVYYISIENNKKVLKQINTGGGSGVDITIVDNLTSASTTDALSANQGKFLNENKLDKKLLETGQIYPNGETGYIIGSSGQSSIDKFFKYNEIYPQLFTVISKNESILNKISVDLANPLTLKLEYNGYQNTVSVTGMVNYTLLNKCIESYTFELKGGTISGNKYAFSFQIFPETILSETYTSDILFTLTKDNVKIFTNDDYTSTNAYNTFLTDIKSLSTEITTITFPGSDLSLMPHVSTITLNLKNISDGDIIYWNGQSFSNFSGESNGNSADNGIGKSGTGENSEIFNDYTNNKATNIYSHAEGSYTTASGYGSHAEGGNTTASGAHSHAEGFLTTALGSYSHAEGNRTIAAMSEQHVQGKYNIKDTEKKYLHIVGNGTSESARSNAHTLDEEGNSWYQGNIKIGGTSYDDETARLVISYGGEKTFDELSNDETLRKKEVIYKINAGSNISSGEIKIYSYKNDSPTDTGTYTISETSPKYTIKYSAENYSNPSEYPDLRKLITACDEGYTIDYKIPISINPKTWTGTTVLKGRAGPTLILNDKLDPTIEGEVVTGTTVTITAVYKSINIPNGDYVMWNGTTWITFSHSTDSQSIDLSNYITKDNTTAYIPSTDYNPATKKYVDDKNERIKYYGDPNIKITPETCFTVNANGDTITGLTDAGKKLTDIVIPYSINNKIITTIGETSGTFSNNTKIRTIIIPNTITNIGMSTFSGCTSLTSINMPDGIKIIPSYLFSGCTSLTSINIPDSVTAIGDNAFKNCILSSISIPDTITYIGSTVFDGCTNLTKVYCRQGTKTDEYFTANYPNINIIYTDINKSELDKKLSKTDVGYTESDKNITYDLGSIANASNKSSKVKTNILEVNNILGIGAATFYDTITVKNGFDKIRYSKFDAATATDTYTTLQSVLDKKANKDDLSMVISCTGDELVEIQSPQIGMLRYVNKVGTGNNTSVVIGLYFYLGTWKKVSLEDVNF